MEENKSYDSLKCLEFLASGILGTQKCFEFNKENKRAYSLFLRDDLSWGEDSPRLPLT